MSFEWVEDAIKQFFNQRLPKLSSLPHPPQIFIGLSGGVDSIVLTHAIQRFLPEKTSLTAVYIHHGLQKEADEWGIFCQQFCQTQQIHFIQKNIKIEQTQRRGLEAVAREQRYQALLECMQDGDCLLTGHHLQDQAETLLLNLFRGSGLNGLAAMPDQKLIRQTNKQVAHVRPLLKVDKTAIYDYARQFGLNWVEDPSNQDLNFRRNRLRNDILPNLKQQWPQLENTLSNTAQHLSESFGLLAELAGQDSQSCLMTSFSVELSRVRHLSWARQKNLLAFWARHHLNGFRWTQDLFNWLEEALNNSNPEAHPQRELAEGVIRVEGDKVFYLMGLKMVYRVSFDEKQLVTLHFDEHDLLTHAIQPVWFSVPNQVTLRSISAEDIQAYPEIKKWFKQHKVVFWNRKRWPVIEINGEIAAILGFKTFDSFK